MTSLAPGELADGLAGLPVAIEAHSVELGATPVAGYYGGEPRPTGVVSLAGFGHAGRGENVDWTPAEQRGFASVCDGLVPRFASREGTTLGEVSDALRRSGAHPHHRAALEAAALDLALRQGATNLFRLAGRTPRAVRFCRSIGRERVASEGPLAAVGELLAVEPEARIKIDCPPEGWPPATWDDLAGTGRIVIVDFKREGTAEQVALAHARLPAAWLEDPPREAMAGARALGRRIALDGWVDGAADLVAPPVVPGAVNVKAPRVGGLLEALRCLERCVAEGWRAYVGGMFEVGVGRTQARVLASLYTADEWNDLAPLLRPRGGSRLAGPLALEADFTGLTADADDEVRGRVRR